MATAATATLTIAISDGSGTPAQSVVGTGAVKQQIVTQIPASTTNQQLALELVRANCTYFSLVSDQNLTLKTNSTGSPGDTKTILAGVPMLFYTGCGQASLATAIFPGADITTTYWSNAGTVAANLYLTAITSS